MSGPDGARLAALETQIARIETRVGQSEGRIDRAEAKLDDIVDRLARLEERVSHLPTKEMVVKIAFGTLALLTAVTVFQSKIQALIGLSR